ncbi:Interferon-induced GTP-binding protein Mx2 [Camelus dromedarius]|uniref:Interferon-induced GTP-binding protein Mx2 n=1 Tax=Camelus dromedarius TaxID=9838 RepID=A0A5N4EK43_CAMDR|nr:Interferon-induced GTP-binding protein Mx2 [Camelus dromedarius]
MPMPYRSRHARRTVFQFSPTPIPKKNGFLPAAATANGAGAGQIESPNWQFGGKEPVFFPKDFKPIPLSEQQPGGNRDQQSTKASRARKQPVQPVRGEGRPASTLVDSLRALGVEQDLALPAIAVIGDQSSGKLRAGGARVPENASFMFGKLPGILTRCPLVLQLKKQLHECTWRGTLSTGTRSSSCRTPPRWREIRKGCSRIWEKGSMATVTQCFCRAGRSIWTLGVSSLVSAAQDAIAGSGVGISHELISLEVTAPEVPDLTLIDLPGIARVAVGNQPQDIGQQIKALITKYIRRQETINLVVVPCNVDIATTEALSMAQEVDPDGDRTIGILTKPDLVDKGTEKCVLNVMQNLTYCLKKGYMIVKCRGQQDILDKMSLAEATRRETLFFQMHPYFRGLLEEGKATVPRLAERLTAELTVHIRVSQRVGLQATKVTARPSHFRGHQLAKTPIKLPKSASKQASELPPTHVQPSPTPCNPLPLLRLRQRVP